MKAPAFIVMKAGQPQALVPLGVGSRKGVLMPGPAAAAFPNRRRARYAIKRTQDAAKEIRTSMLSEWKRLEPLLSAEPYTIVPLAGAKA